MLTGLDRTFQAYEMNGFRSVSRGDFEMRTEAVPPRLSQEAGSISSTDTSEIGFGLPVSVHRDQHRPPAALISQKKGQSIKGQKGGSVVAENNVLCHSGTRIVFVIINIKGALCKNFCL